MKKITVKLIIIVTMIFAIVTSFSGCSLKKHDTENKKTENQTNQEQQNGYEKQANEEDNIKYEVIDTGYSIITLENGEKALVSNYKQLEHILTENEQNSNPDEFKKLKSLFDKYDDTYFTDKSLAVYVVAENVGVDFKLESIKKNDNIVQMNYKIEDTRESDISIQVMHGYVVVAEVDKGITDIVKVEQDR